MCSVRSSDWGDRSDTLFSLKTHLFKTAFSLLFYILSYFLCLNIPFILLIYFILSTAILRRTPAHLPLLIHALFLSPFSLPWLFHATSHLVPSLSSSSSPFNSSCSFLILHFSPHKVFLLSFSTFLLTSLPVSLPLFDFLSSPRCDNKNLLFLSICSIFSPNPPSAVIKLVFLLHLLFFTEY